MEDPWWRTPAHLLLPLEGDRMGTFSSPHGVLTGLVPARTAAEFRDR